MKPREIIELISDRLVHDVLSCSSHKVKTRDKAIRNIAVNFNRVRCNRQYMLDQIQNLLAPYDDEAVTMGGAGVKACWNLLDGDVDTELDILTSLNDPEINPTTFLKALGNAILRKYKLLSKYKDAQTNTKLVKAQHGSQGKISR